ncbi:thiamine pyrophosphate-binding protein [Polaribacter sp. R77954]|uniref:thiamine pyrophosphate-binding protein n=1 Tax=Polaribacter sp. R77954 TaxID=3093870 RepID=UPI0037C6EB68
MKTNYTTERNVQMVLSLLKQNGIRKIIASPGGTNMTFVASMQQDPFFEIYSSVDERSAAYIATGLAAETGETVVLSCTGATASRNYLPGLTEAYYRKLPVLAITSGRSITNIGHLMDQVIDRSVMPKDVVNLSVTIPEIKDKEDEWHCMINLNKAILELNRNGGGPVHINLPTTYSRDFSVKELPNTHRIQRVSEDDIFPEIKHNRIGVFVGSHMKWTKDQLESINEFCEANNAVVLCDHTSNYKGKYRVLFPLIEAQNQALFKNNELDLLVHIGEVSNCGYRAKEVWRVSEDGEVRDTFKKLSFVFDMPEKTFFKHYSVKKTDLSNTLLDEFNKQNEEFYNKIPDLPFSNIWVAKQLAPLMPENSVLHLGIRNSLRAWNFFEIPESVLGYSNVGGFGIDGVVSSLIGASLADRKKLYFGVTGDLAFFYDINSLGNRHIGNNVRLLIINNGRGQEFKNFDSMGTVFETEDTDAYIAAGGHYGNKSDKLVKHYAEDLGFEYLAASNKNEFEKVYEKFINKDLTSKSIVLEVFTETIDENEAYKLISSLTMSGKIVGSARGLMKGKAFNLAKKIIKK